MADDVALQIPITSDPNPFKRVMAEVKQNVSGAMESVRNTMGGVRDAFGAAGIMAAGYLKGAIESAAKSEQSTERLKKIVENQGQSWDKASKQVNNFTSGITKMSTYSGGQAKEALTVLEQKGVKLNDALRGQNALVDLAAGKNMDLSQAAGVLADAYNGKTKALLSLGLATKDEIKNGMSYDDVLKRINERFGGSAAGQLNTYNGQMQQLTNNMNSFKTSIGTYILPYFNQLAKHLNSLAQYINSLDPSIKKMIAGVMGATAVLGSLIGGVGLVQKVMGVLGPTVSGIGSLIGGLSLPIVAVIAGIALLTAAYAKNWGGIRDKTMEVINYIKPIIINGFNAVVAWFKEHWPEIKAVFQAVLKALEMVFNQVLVPILKFIIQEFAVVIDWVKANWPLIQATITLIINNIKNNIMIVVNLIVAFWKANGETIMENVKFVWNIIKTVIDTVLHVILGLIKFVMQLITGDWKGAWNTLCDIVKTIFVGIIKIISDILDHVEYVFSNAAKNALNWGANLINGFIDGIKSKIKAVKDAASGVIKTVKDYMGFNSPAKEGEGRHIVEWGANMINGFMDGIRSKLPEMQKLMAASIKGVNTNINMSALGSVAGAEKESKIIHQHEVSGEIDVKGVNNAGQTVAATKVVAGELATSQFRFQYNPELRRLLKA